MRTRESAHWPTRIASMIREVRCILRTRGQPLYFACLPNEIEQRRPFGEDRLFAAAVWEGVGSVGQISDYLCAQSSEALLKAQALACPS